MQRRAVISALAVILAGSFLHFAWELSGKSEIVAVFAAINESTWEHLKMAFWPSLVAGLLHRFLYGRLPGLLAAIAAAALIPPVLIVAFFYGYTSLTGDNILAADIGIFAAAIFLGQLAGHSLIGRHFSTYVRIGAAILIIAATVAFSVLTFMPPDHFLFEDPLGIPHV